MRAIVSASASNTFTSRFRRSTTARGAKQVTPRLRAGDANMPQRPWIDGFSSGYVRRSMHQFPRQGDREPWVNPQNYRSDQAMIRRGPIEDDVLQFTSPAAQSGQRDLVIAASKLAA